MQSAFGFAGAPGANPETALAAPQAGLLSTLSQGVIGGDLNWNLLGVGALIGIVVIAINEVLTRTTKKYSLPGLAVGMGMYLPMAVTVIIPLGALLGVIYDKWAEKQKDPERAKRMGVLAVTGLIVGESLWGVVLAAIVAGSGNDTPLAVVGDGFAPIATWLGPIVFAAVIAGLYFRARQMATDEVASAEADKK